MKNHTEVIRDVAFSPNSEELIGAGSNGTIWIWNTKSGMLHTRLVGHKEQVSCIAYSPDSKYIISGGKVGSIRIWSRWKLIEIARIESVGEIHSVAIDPKCRFVAFSTEEGTSVWDVNLEQQLFNLSIDALWNTVIFSPNGESLVVVGNKAVTNNRMFIEKRGYIKIIDTVTWTMKELLKGKLRSSDWHYQPTYNPQGDKLTCATYSGRMPVWDIPTRKIVFYIEHPSPAEQGLEHRSSSQAACV